MKKSEVIQFQCRRFTAGVVLHNGRVVQAAPIIKYLMRWSKVRVLDYAARKGWKVL